MIPLRYAFPFLLIAAQAHSAPCDKRVLPRNDTLSVEAAARAATHGTLPDIHAQEACILGTTTSVTLIAPNRNASDPAARQWTMICTRDPSTWAKRGGWTCSTPQLRRE
jgi:hypothetical protein